MRTGIATQAVQALRITLAALCGGSSFVIQAQDTANTPPASVADAQQERFDVYELRVLGNSVLSNEQVELAVYPHLGPGKVLADVEAARLALESAYKEAGYGTVFVDIPEQDVAADGVVRLRVTEGKLDRVRITGARYFSNGRLRNALPSLERGQVPYLPGVQKDLSAANAQARDRSVTPVMKAGRTPGTIDMELKVEDSLPLHGSIEVNDRYTADTSRTRASWNLSYDNLWQRFHSLSLQYQTAPENREEARVIAGTYLAPVGGAGHMVALYAVDTNSDVATVGTLSVLGAGRIYGARYIIPLPASESYFHSISLGGDYKDFEEGILLEGGDRDRTPIAYTSWSAGYTGTLRGQSSTTGVNVTTTFGIRSLTNTADEFEYKRYLARPNFFHVRAGIEHEHRIWAGSRAYLRLTGQYTPEALISNEQFSIGGAESVRGYLESEALGEYGASGTLEWRTPSLVRWTGEVASDFYLLTFVDAGIVNVNESLPGQASSTTLSSVGLGLRLSAFGGLAAEIDGAYTLRATDRTQAHDTRIHFQLRYGF